MNYGGDVTIRGWSILFANRFGLGVFVSTYTMDWRYIFKVSNIFYCRYFRGIHHPHVQLLQKYWGAPNGTGGTGTPYHNHHSDAR